MKERLTRYTGATAMVLLLLAHSSCSKGDIDPLNPNAGDKQEVNYTWAATADSLQAATYDTFLSTEGTFKQDNSGNENFNYWWNAHMLDALVDGYLRTNDEHYKLKMKAILKGIKVKNGGTYQNVFNDDMEWLGMACTRAYQATEDPEYLAVAQELWNEIKKGWSDVFGGGITWKTDTPYGKNACSNGPAAILAVQLYQIEGNTEDLEWAKKIYAWEKETLVDPTTGLVWDNISRENGETVINKDWVFTYNLGTYIGAATKLYEVTHNEMYLNDAVKTATSTMTSPKVTSEGILKSEGQGDGGLFKGILVRHFTQLLQLPELTDNKRQGFIKFLKFNAETFFENGISRPAMMSSPDWRKKPGTTTDLSTQLSGVMLMEAAAHLKEAKLF